MSTDAKERKPNGKRTLSLSQQRIVLQRQNEKGKFITGLFI